MPRTMRRPAIFIDSLYLQCYNPAAMQARKLLLPLLVIAAAAVMPAQQAASRPNLSGNWVFSPQKSSLKMPAPTSMTLQIEHNDPQVRFLRTQNYGDQSFKWELDTLADGQKEVVQDSPQYKSKVRLYWEGSALVLDQQITADDGTKASDIVTYSLLDDGKVLQAVERQTTIGAKGSMTNKWVYDRQAP